MQGRRLQASDRLAVLNALRLEQLPRRHGHEAAPNALAREAADERAA